MFSFAVVLINRLSILVSVIITKMNFTILNAFQLTKSTLTLSKVFGYI